MVCPACNSNNSFHWGSYEKTPVFKCKECCTIFFPRPISEKNNYYDYHQTSKQDDKQRAMADVIIRRKQTAAKASVIFSKIERRSLRILDIGSGPGLFAAGLRELGHEVVCGDVNIAAIEYGEKNYGNRFVDIFEPNLGLFDVVTLFHVIEHLEYPDHLVLRSLELLRPGGLFYAHVPKGETMSNTLETSLKRLVRPRHNRSGCLYIPDHFTGFSVKGLKKFGVKVGLSDVEVKALGFFSSEYDPWFLNLRGKGLGSVPRRGVELLRGVVDAAWGGAWLRILGRKPLAPTDAR